MSMDSISVLALILSIIAILLWVYTFLFKEKSIVPVKRNVPGKREPEPPGSEPHVQTMPDVVRQENQMKILEQQAQWEARFMSETQKFSQMARKNLEMLNTRVGIKFDVKPISDDFKKRPRGPEFVDSMEVSDDRKQDFEAETSD